MQVHAANHIAVLAHAYIRDCAFIVSSSSQDVLMLETMYFGEVRIMPQSKAK